MVYMYTVGSLKYCRVVKESKVLVNISHLICVCV